MTGQLEGVGWERDLAVLCEWWAAVSVDAPPDLAGLWFGLADLVTADGAARHLYAAGCPTFDGDDPDAEWATEYTWGPSSPVLVLGVAAPPDSAYRVALEYAASLVAALRPTDHVPAAGVAVGYDDGDFLVVPRATP